MDTAAMALRGRIGAFIQHSRHDARETTEKARQTFLASFEQQVDPSGTLAPDVRARRAEYARRAHFSRLALASVMARTKKKAVGHDSDDLPTDLGNAGVDSALAAV